MTSFFRCKRAPMEEETNELKERVKELFAARESSDRSTAYKAFAELMKLAEKPVKRSYGE